MILSVSASAKDTDVRVTTKKYSFFVKTICVEGYIKCKRSL